VNDIAINELLKRVKRFETRFTRYLRIQGFDKQMAKPEWRDGVLVIPTLFTPLADILEAIPKGGMKQPPEGEGVDIHCNGMKIANILTDPDYE
jgi:hypothetical protein